MIPFYRSLVVLGHSLPLVIAVSKTVLSTVMPLFCRLLIPFRRLSVILVHFDAIFIGPSQLITLLRGLSVRFPAALILFLIADWWDFTLFPLLNSR